MSIMITRADALSIARRTLELAEQERIDAADAEANIWGERDTMDIRTLQETAVRSVRGRGFYADLPTVAGDRLLMAQWLRFTEEVGELSRAIRKDEGASVEMADVLIVLFQLAHVLGVDLETSVIAKLEADEARGHLHNGSADLAPPWAKAKVISGECHQ